MIDQDRIITSTILAVIIIGVFWVIPSLELLLVLAFILLILNIYAILSVFDHENKLYR